MNVKKCSNGHFFDADKYQLCPHCGASIEESSGVQYSAPEKTDRQAGKKKKRRTTESVIKPMPQRTMGKTFGIFDEPEPQFRPEKSVRVASDVSSADKADKKAKKECPVCGKMISEKARFCKYCGKSLAEEADNRVNRPPHFFELQNSAETDEPNIELKAGEASLPEDAAGEAPELSVDSGGDHQTKDIFSSKYAYDAYKHSADHTSSFEDAVKNAASGNYGKTVGFFSMGKSEKPNEIDPVVGWLVCIKGQHFGESFSISAGRNSVGRGVSNKIILHNDVSVSREKHVWITYDPKHKVFYIQPGESSGLSYLNGETVTETKKLTGKDKIEIGNGTYLFVPLCGEDFSWEEYIE